VDQDRHALENTRAKPAKRDRTLLCDLEQRGIIDILPDRETGGRQLAPMPFDPLDSILRGQPAGDTGTLHDAMQLDLHWVGRGGVAGFAIAVV
jgi:hypothetical protein